MNRSKLIASLLKIEKIILNIQLYRKLNHLLFKKKKSIENWSCKLKQKKSKISDEYNLEVHCSKTEYSLSKYS